MKCVILAGGEGTRISEETRYIPKPMIRVGDRPLLRHIMDIYINQGINEFIIPVGYKSEIITSYFLTYENTTLNQVDGNLVFSNHEWKATVVETGKGTQTGGRIGRLRDLLTEDFCMTYGDGVGNPDIQFVLREHKAYRTVATITAVRPVPRFGSVIFKPGEATVLEFGEKTERQRDWINGGFAVLSPRIFDYIVNDNCNLEKDVYPVLADTGELCAVKHEGFWHCVDTLRDLQELETIYKEHGASWAKQ